MSQQFFVITLTGPRQSGKTTLVKHLFPEKQYVSLEDIDERQDAKNDPRSFLQRYPEGAIIDEVQHVPELFSYIQTRVDTTKKEGEFILTGSHNFLLLEKISQSLAGRTCVIHLLPLSYQELQKKEPLYTLIHKGFYPKLHEKDIDVYQWYSSYVSTYIERDIRQIKNITDLSKFQTFIQLCAGRVGQLLNVNALSSIAGLDYATTKSWLSILEASFVIYFLRPHHKNFNKRLVKQSKLYFYDTGLAAYLLEIEKPEDLYKHYARGPLFENFVVTELIKKRWNTGKRHNLFFWRDHHGHEVDVLFSKGETLVPIEVKSNATIQDGFFKELRYFQTLSGVEHSYLVYAGDKSKIYSNNTTAISWDNINAIPLEG